MFTNAESVSDAMIKTVGKTDIVDVSFHSMVVRVSGFLLGDLPMILIIRYFCSISLSKMKNKSKEE